MDSFTEAELMLRLEFKNPPAISIQVDDPNKVQIEVADSSLFIRKKDGMAVPEATRIASKLPRQVDRELGEAMALLGQIIRDSGKG